MVEHYTFATPLAASGYDYMSVLDMVLPASYTSAGSTITHRNTTIDGHSGLLVTQSGNGVDGQFEVFVVGADLYMIIAAHKATDTTLDTQTFFNSFHVS